MTRPPTETLPARPDGDAAPERVLIVRLGAVGDVVRTLPAVGRLRRAWPETEIAWAVESASAPFVELHPDVDRAIVLPRGRLAETVRGFDPSVLSSFVDELQTHRAEVSFDFQSSLKSGLVSWLSGATTRFGFVRGESREGSHLFANVRVRSEDSRVSRVLRAERLVRAAGVPDLPLEIDLGLTRHELDRGRELRGHLLGTLPAVALAPFSSKRQSWKRYPLSGWARVARSLSQEGVGVIILYGPGEDDYAARLIDDARHDGATGSVVACGRIGLREMAALTAASDTFVGGDTGPMHIAWAVGTPVVAVYGPTDPVLNAPYGEGHLVLAPPSRTGREDSDKFPGITPERVASAARELLVRDRR